MLFEDISYSTGTAKELSKSSTAAVAFARHLRWRGALLAAFEPTRRGPHLVPAPSGAQNHWFQWVAL